MFIRGQVWQLEVIDAVLVGVVVGTFFASFLFQDLQVIPSQESFIL